MPYQKAMRFLDIRKDKESQHFMEVGTDLLR